MVKQYFIEKELVRKYKDMVFVLPHADKYHTITELYDANPDVNTDDEIASVLYSDNEVVSISFYGDVKEWKGSVQPPYLVDYFHPSNAYSDYKNHLEWYCETTNDSVSETLGYVLSGELKSITTLDQALDFVVDAQLIGFDKGASKVLIRLATQPETGYICHMSFEHMDVIFAVTSFRSQFGITMDIVIGNPELKRSCLVDARSIAESVVAKYRRKNSVVDEITELLEKN